MSASRVFDGVRQQALAGEVVSAALVPLMACLLSIALSPIRRS